MTVERAPFDFEPDETPQEFPAAASVPVPLPRDESGKVVRVDWSDGPPPPAPDANFEPPSDADAEGAEIVAEQNGDEPGTFDELHPNVQAIVRDQEGYDQTLASIDTVKADLGDAFAEAESDFEELPVDAQKVVYALLSHDWKPHGAEVLADAYDQLNDILPLTSSAALREFLVDHGFVEG